MKTHGRRLRPGLPLTRLYQVQQPHWQALGRVDGGSQPEEERAGRSRCDSRLSPLFPRAAPKGRSVPTPPPSSASSWLAKCTRRLRRGNADSSTAPQNHLCINQPSGTSLIFAYQARHAPRLFTEAKSFGEVRKVAHTASLKFLQGQGIRISPDTCFEAPPLTL